MSEESVGYADVEAPFGDSESHELEVRQFVEHLIEEENAKEEMAGIGMLAVGLFFPLPFVAILFHALAVPLPFLLVAMAIPGILYKLYPYWVMHRSKRPLPVQPGLRLSGRKKTQMLCNGAIVVAASIIARPLMTLVEQGDW